MLIQAAPTWTLPSFITNDTRSVAVMSAVGSLSDRQNRKRVIACRTSAGSRPPELSTCCTARL